jgi:hypothetical protein
VVFADIHRGAQFSGDVGRDRYHHLFSAAHSPNLESVSTNFQRRVALAIRSRTGSGLQRIYGILQAALEARARLA